MPAILFLAGLTGGVAHCGPMCGPIVLGQVGARIAALPQARLCEINRHVAGALPLYHLGRITTYATLGGLVALGGGALAPSATTRGALLLLGALYLVMMAGARLGLWRGATGPTMPGFLGRGLRRLTSVARRLGPFPLGLALGLIPCGLIYAALAVVAASATPVMGALSMAAFGLGTVPVLLVIGVVGQTAGRRFAGGLGRATPFILLANAGMLAGLAILPLL